jgi:hypothetical protein
MLRLGTTDARVCRLMNRMKLREQLAALEHEQWVEWSRHLAASEELSADRLARWRRSWVPYAQLPEHQKDLDRTYADHVLALLDAVLAAPPAQIAVESEAET